MLSARLQRRDKAQALPARITNNDSRALNQSVLHHDCAPDTPPGNGSANLPPQSFADLTLIKPPPSCGLGWT